MFFKVTSSAFFVILYWWLLPTFIYLTMRWRALVADFEFIELLSVYGYSMFVFIPVSILWLVHISIVQWTLVIMAIALSGSVLIFTFWPIFSPDPNRKVNVNDYRFNNTKHLISCFLLFRSDISLWV